MIGRRVQRTEHEKEQVNGISIGTAERHGFGQHACCQLHGFDVGGSHVRQCDAIAKRRRKHRFASPHLFAQGVVRHGVGDCHPNECGKQFVLVRRMQGHGYARPREEVGEVQMIGDKVDNSGNLHDLAHRWKEFW